MKQKLVIRVIIGLIILSCFSIPALAGVAPTPWHTQVNRLNSAMNSLHSVNTRLAEVFYNPPAPEGAIGKLDAMTNQLYGLNDKIMAALSGVPMKPEPPEIGIVLMDINRGAMETVKITGIGMRNENEGLRNAFMKVQMAAEMIITTVKDWMMNPIYVADPFNKDICVIGFPCFISWDTSNIQGYNMVWLEVVYPDGSECCGSYPVPNTGSYLDFVPDPSWADPGVLCQPFRIKIYTNDNEYWGVSGLFKVSIFLVDCSW
jgi:hypothetical protein